MIQKRTAQLTSYEYDMEGNPSLIKFVEVIILGQAGTTRQGGGGSYAKSKIMFEDIVNRMLNHLKDKLILLKPYKFNIRRAIDTDELQLLRGVTGLSNLNGTDTNEKSLTVPVQGFIDNFGIPFENNGAVALKLPPARINLE